MFRLSTHSRRATAASLLVVFLNVFFGQAVCAWAMPAAAAHEHTAVASVPGHKHEHPAGTPPHHHEPEAPATRHAHHAATDKHHHEANSPVSHSHKPAKGSCCQDDAAAVWASLAHPPKASVEKLTLPAFVMPAAPFALVVRAQQWDRSQPVLLVARRRLKPKIPDIRIFIQSLTV